MLPKYLSLLFLKYSFPILFIVPSFSVLSYSFHTAAILSLQTHQPGKKWSPKPFIHKAISILMGPSVNKDRVEIKIGTVKLENNQVNSHEIFFSFCQGFLLKNLYTGLSLYL